MASHWLRYQYNNFRNTYPEKAVFPQRGNDGKDRQIDMILITDSLTEFHRANKLTNQSDYSNFMRNKSPDSLASWNSKATGLYFNQFVKIDQGKIPWWFSAFSLISGELKYGVISTQHLINDLKNWEHLYISGRLHKPVKLVTPNGLDFSESRPDSDSELSTALEVWIKDFKSFFFENFPILSKSNLISAMRVASLLQESEKTNFDQLVLTICNLSYLGDIRQKGFEDTKKVEKIVEGSYEYLKALYVPIIEKCDWLETSGSEIFQVGS